MTDPVAPDAETPEPYVAARLERALLEDGRVGEGGLVVELHGHRVTVSGVVGSEQRRDAVALVVREVAPGYELNNLTEVAMDRAPTTEDLP